MELFSTFPPFLVRSVCFLHSYFTLFPSFYVLLDVITWLFYFINVIDYSVKVLFLQDKSFFTFL